MHCTEAPPPRSVNRRRIAALAAALLPWFAGCNSQRQQPDPVLPETAPAAVVAAPAPPIPNLSPARPAASALGPGAMTEGPAEPAPRHVKLPAPKAPRNFDELRLQAARRLVAAHPDGSYMTPSPQPLLAIPVLEIELNGDGSVRRIVVLRVPTQARDTTQLAIEAVRRAAPFGNVTQLPRPWKFAETFLFDDERRFKPRSLD